MQRKLFGLTNALMDVTVKASYEDLKCLGIKKGETVSHANVDKERLEFIVSKQKPVYFPAGSTANVIFNANRLGLKTVLFGTVGKDDFGKKYLEKLNNTDIFYVVNQASGRSGRVYVLVTPDGERTQVCDKGVAGEFGFETYSAPIACAFDFFHTTGYEVASNPQGALELAMDFAKLNHTKISFDLASEFAIGKAKKEIEEIAYQATVLFATEEEAMNITQCDTPFKALNQLAKKVPIAVLKRGNKGSVVRSMGKQYHVDAYPTKLKSTCGAGDAYASGFLFGYLHNFSVDDCGRFGSFIASRVCASEMPHL